MPIYPKINRSPDVTNPNKLSYISPAMNISIKYFNLQTPNITNGKAINHQP